MQAVDTYQVTGVSGSNSHSPSSKSTPHFELLLYKLQIRVGGVNLVNGSVNGGVAVLQV